MDMSILYSIAMGIALSASAGFRVFIPVLVTALAAHYQFIDLPLNLEWLGSWPAIVVFGIAAIIEVIAYYIPFVDNILDTIAAPLAVAAGTLIATSILPLENLDPAFRWGIGLIAGGSAAGTIQMGTGLLRLFSSKATLGTGNAVVATGENAAASAGAVLSLFMPVIIALAMVALIIWIITRIFVRFFGGKSARETSQRSS